MMDFIQACVGVAIGLALIAIVGFAVWAGYTWAFTFFKVLECKVLT